MKLINIIPFIDSLQSTVYSLQSTVYSLQSTVYSLHSKKLLLHFSFFLERDYTIHVCKYTIFNIRGIL